MPFEVVTDQFDRRIPAGPAAAASVVLLGCRAYMRFRRDEGFCREHRTRRQTVVEWRRTVHQVRRVANREIRRNLSAHSAIRLNRLILSRRQPKVDLGEIQTDPDNLSEMIEIL